MDLFVMKWKSGEYYEYRHEYLRDLGLAAEVSGESASVNNTPKKKNERLFWLDNGVQVYCENHVKLSDGYRMHFYVDSAEKCIYVAYLGPHLTLWIIALSWVMLDKESLQTKLILSPHWDWEFGNRVARQPAEI